MRCDNAGKQATAAYRCNHHLWHLECFVLGKAQLLQCLTEDVAQRAQAVGTSATVKYNRDCGWHIPQDGSLARDDPRIVIGMNIHCHGTFGCTTLLHHKSTQLDVGGGGGGGHWHCRLVAAMATGIGKSHHETALVVPATAYIQFIHQRQCSQMCLMERLSFDMHLGRVCFKRSTLLIGDRVVRYEHGTSFNTELLSNSQIQSNKPQSHTPNQSINQSINIRSKCNRNTMRATGCSDHYLRQ
jgi:hypothetical protein